MVLILAFCIKYINFLLFQKNDINIFIILLNLIKLLEIYNINKGVIEIYVYTNKLIRNMLGNIYYQP